MRALLLISTIALTACGPTPSTPDAGSPDPLDAGSDAGLDAGTDAGPPPDGGCVTCTELTARFGTRTALFTRAQHGVEPDGTLYVEAYFGGDPACPTSTSPTPDRTLIISGLRADAGVQTWADGVRVSLFDFTGEVTSAPLERAREVTATPGLVTPGARVDFDLTVAFDGGTISGHISAPHCTSLDGP